VDILLRRDAKINSNSSSIGSPFYYAADGGYEKVARYLLGRGAKVDVERNQYEKTLLSMVSSQRHAADVEMLLDLGAPINQKDPGLLDETAISEGHEIVVKILLDRGAAIELRNSKGQTPLFQAVQRGRESLVKLLLDSGAEVDFVRQWMEYTTHMGNGKGALRNCENSWKRRIGNFEGS
jgi:ankyrin repeat protein